MLVLLHAPHAPQPESRDMYGFNAGCMGVHGVHVLTKKTKKRVHGVRLGCMVF